MKNHRFPRKLKVFVLFSRFCSNKTCVHSSFVLIKHGIKFGMFSHKSLNLNVIELWKVFYFSSMFIHRKIPLQNNWFQKIDFGRVNFNNFQKTAKNNCPFNWIQRLFWWASTLFCPAPECIYLIAIKWWDQAMKLLQVFKLSTREAKTVCCTRLQRPKSTVCVCFENDNMHMRNWTRSFIPSWCGSRLTKRVLQQQKQQQSAICAE